MVKLSEQIQKYQNDDTLKVNYDTHKLEQKTRNRVKQELTAALLSDIAEELDDQDVVVVRVEKGIGIAFPTPQGYFPATIEITMKATDLDVDLQAQEYAEKLQEKKAKREESLAVKRAKMESDAIKREKKRREREAKEAEKLAKLEAEQNAQ